MNDTATMEWLKLKSPLFTILIIFAIIGIFNIRGIMVSGIIRSDNIYATHNLLTFKQSLSFNEERGVPIARSINNLLFRYIFPFSPLFTRIVIVAFAMVPISLLCFFFYYRYFRLPYMAALTAACFPNIIPNQTLIPVFINGSYQVYALLPFFAAMFYGVRYVEGSNEEVSKNALGGIAGLVLISLFSTELALFLFVPGIVILSVVAKTGRRLVQVTIAGAVACILWLGWFALQPHFAANRAALLSLEEIWARFVYFCYSVLPFISSAPGDVSDVVVLVLLGLLGAGLGVGSLFTGTWWARIGHRFTREEGNARFELAVALALIWIVFSSLPFVVLSTHGFTDRYGYPASIGVGLLIVGSLMGISQISNRLRPHVPLFLMIFLLATGAQRLVKVDKTYARFEDDFKQIAIALKSRYYPPFSQVVIDEERGNFLNTAGVYSWSTGYLQYIMQRRDVSGLVGPVMQFHNPFRAWAGDWTDKMVGLRWGLPIFLYRYDGTAGTLTQYEYALIWDDSGQTEDWHLLRLARDTGEAKVLVEGSGVKEYLSVLSSLRSIIDSRNSVYWDAAGARS